MRPASAPSGGTLPGFAPGSPHRVALPGGAEAPESSASGPDSPRELDLYAIVRAGGRQEKVAVGDIVVMDRVAGQPGDSVELPVLLVVSDGVVTSDADALAQARVQAEVVGHERGPKIRILRYKNKTGYRRRQGHRQDLTRVKVTTIDTGSASTKSTAKAEA